MSGLVKQAGAGGWAGGGRWVGRRGQVGPRGGQVGARAKQAGAGGRQRGAGRSRWGPEGGRREQVGGQWGAGRGQRGAGVEEVGGRWGKVRRQRGGRREQLGRPEQVGGQRGLWRFDAGSQSRGHCGPEPKILLLVTVYKMGLLMQYYDGKQKDTATQQVATTTSKLASCNLWLMSVPAQGGTGKSGIRHNCDVWFGALRRAEAAARTADDEIVLVML